MLVHWISVFFLPKRAIHELNSIFRRFLWSGVDLAHKHCPIGWKSICYPNNEGGLAVRDISTMNLAANLRHLWDLKIRKPTLWVEWVHKNKDFWSMKTPSNSSWCWRRILDHREYASKFIFNIVGKGNTIRFWKDNWHPLGILVERFPLSLRYDSTLHINALVSSCINDDTWLIPSHIQPTLTTLIQGIMNTPIDPLEDDEVTWTAGNSGLYTLKDTYEALRPRTQVVYWSKLVWFKHCIPRHCFITWVALHRRLKTKDKLNSWGIDIDITCTLCRISVEDDRHLFFSCEVCFLTGTMRSAGVLLTSMVILLRLA
ncbi:Reverse transcriptase zinc-binding domain [Macleaya cordata]|uniref:Reverse transcriptase zinc-binding domain n=1 Tax=Macleaya cordata TaxID=56857 RepID=A0A200PSP5_MACCD|nr:Reverse transcriptase zinc-binding domain [Macleaya cordata]